MSNKSTKPDKIITSEQRQILNMRQLGIDIEEYKSDAYEVWRSLDGQQFKTNNDVYMALRVNNAERKNSFMWTEEQTEVSPTGSYDPVKY